MKTETLTRCLKAVTAVVFLAVMQSGAYTTNSIPKSWSFEGLEDGSNITAYLGWQGEDDAVKALLLDYPAPSHPINTNHTMVAELSDNVTIHVDGQPLNQQMVWVDYLVKPKRWEEDEPPGDIPGDAQLAIYVDSNGWLNVYHSDFDEDYNLLPPAWSVVDDPGYYMTENEWVRLSVGTDYRRQIGGDDLASFFQVRLNGNPIRHANAHFDPHTPDYWAEDLSGPDANDGELGTWFAMAHPSASQLNAVTLRGSGLFDDFVISEDVPVVNPIFYYHITTSYEGNGVVLPEFPGHTAKVLPGGSQAFTWQPDHTDYFSSVAIVENGVTTTNLAGEGYDGGYTFSNVTENGSFHVVFLPKDLFFIETSVTGGTISPTGTVTVIDGDDQPFTWSPSFGYVFTNVTIVENGVTNVYEQGGAFDHGYTFNTVTGHGSVDVVFAVLPTVDIVASAINGTIEPDGVVQVPVGESRPYSFSWHTTVGFKFDSVTVIVDGATNTYPAGEGYDTGYPLSNVTTNFTTNGSIEVTFAPKDIYTITATVTDGTVNPAVTNVFEGENAVFTWEPESGFQFFSVTIVENGNPSTYYAGDGFDTGYTFFDVLDDGSIDVVFEEITLDPGLLQWLLDTGLGADFDMTEEAWAAYTASTDPNDPLFRFEVSRSWNTAGTNFVEWKSIYVDTNLPPFDIMRSTNAALPFTLHDSYIRVAADEPDGIRTNVWWEAAPAFPAFYRIVATNAPMPVDD